MFATVELFLNGSKPDGSFTMAVSNSFLGPLEKNPWLQIWENLGCFLFYTENNMLCVLIRGDSNGNQRHAFMLKIIHNISLLNLLI